MKARSRPVSAAYRYYTKTHRPWAPEREVVRKEWPVVPILGVVVIGLVLGATLAGLDAAPIKLALASF